MAYICTHTHTHSHTHTLTTAHICTHTYTLTHIHTHTHNTHTLTHNSIHVHYLAFFVSQLCRPKTDTCKTCDSLNVQITSEEDSTVKRWLQFDLQLYQCKAERAYQQLKEDAALSRLSQSVDTITFDLQQSLPIVKLSTSVVFYKRLLWVFIFGIQDCSSDKGYMFMWPESVASRGSHESSLSILQYVKLRKSDTTHLIHFSDACSGQNHNINIACLWMYIVCSSELHTLWLTTSSWLQTIPTYQTIGISSLLRRLITYSLNMYMYMF